jgi:dihydrofolate synthase/folylpolyglutamate synthase
MRYVDAARLLYGLAPRGVQLGLGRMRKALSLRGDPQRAYPCIIVAGTNGKGSVSAMLSSILRASGLRVGLYTSPHLHRMVERFRIDDKPIAMRAFAERVSELAPWLTARGTPELTFFEACTLLAFEIFRDAEVDVAVLEVGLGGRLDATNVVDPILSVITHIALDHQDRLGDSIEQIAAEKAGIIKRGVPVVLAPQGAEAHEVIEHVAKSRRAPLVPVPCDGGDVLGSALSGAFQQDNVRTVQAAVESLRVQGFAIADKAVERGLQNVRWPGRLELIAGAPSVLLDAAHNPDACMQLSRHLGTLRERFPKRVLVFGALADKPIAMMLALLRPHVQHVMLTTAGSPRAIAATDLERRFGGSAVNDPIAALRKAQKLAGKRGLVVVAGSIFVMAPLRAHLLGLSADPPIAM